MFKTVLGIFLVLLPTLMSSLLFFTDTEYFWFYSDIYPLYDLAYSILCLVVFCVGIVLMIKKPRASLILSFTMVFAVYQILAWGFYSKRYIASIPITATSHVLLIPYDVGAISPKSVVTLEVTTRHNVLFISNNRLKEFTRIARGSLHMKNAEIIEVELETYDKEKIYEEWAVQDILTPK